MGSTLETGALRAIRCDDEAILGDDRAWSRAHSVPPPSVADLEQLAAGDHWGGPLIVSMPRTGSTLLGMLLLYATEPDGRPFDRYVHEPAAPMFWLGSSIGEATSFVDDGLSESDIVQDSAYQFAHPDVARWFATQARYPIIFTMRHPQRAWPSRWRALLGQLVSDQPDHPIARQARMALQTDDYSGLGEHLTAGVNPADNGVLAFDWMLRFCRQEGIDHVIVDNGLLRQSPDDILEQLCDRLEIGYTPAITAWRDLGAVLPKVAMSDLASGDEYEWYYAGTLGSSKGIEPENRPLLDLDRFPDELRGRGGPYLTIDEAVLWYEDLLQRPETLTPQS